MEGMTPRQRYRFDLDGYLVIEDALDEDEVAALNDLIDDQELPPPTEETGSGRRFGDYFEWGQPFVDLLDHEAIAPVLYDLLGPKARLDHYYGIYMEAGGETLHLHGGGTPYDPSQYYHNRNDQPYCGLTVFAWNLAPTGPEYGGFCCIPGSHRANYPTPDGVNEAVEAATTPAELPPEVVVPEAPAGSVVIFTEALTHGTAPWVADHQRRSVLNKYSPHHMTWADEPPTTPEGVALTDRQERLFEPPYVWRRESVFE